MARRRSSEAPAPVADRFDRLAEVLRLIGGRWLVHSDEPQLAKWFTARAGQLIGERLHDAEMRALRHPVRDWSPGLVAAVDRAAAAGNPDDWSLFPAELGPEAPGRPARAYLIDVSKWPWPSQR